MKTQKGLRLPSPSAAKVASVVRICQGLRSQVNCGSEHPMSLLQKSSCLRKAFMVSSTTAKSCFAVGVRQGLMNTSRFGTALGTNER